MATTTSKAKHSLPTKLVFWLTPFISTVVWFLVWNGVNQYYFDAAVRWFPSIELGLLGLVSYILFLFSRNLLIFLVLQALLIGFLYISNGLKIAFFGGPIVPADLHSFTALARILEGHQFWYLALPIIAIGLMFFGNLKKSYWGGFLLLACITIGTVIAETYPRQTLKLLDSHFQYVLWDQNPNYQRMGAGLYFLQANLREIINQKPLPKLGQVTSAYADLTKHATTNSGLGHPHSTKRNLYIIVVESLWDASQLKAAEFSKDVFAPEFRNWWQQADESTILSPSFGGGTANGEFELLCGLPTSFAKGVVFDYAVTAEEVPCLPQLLQEAGYDTLAYHANVAAFWNRVNVYRNIGFTERHFKASFVLDDLNGLYLADSSFYKQAMQIADSKQTGQPQLNYLLTISSHWPYPLNSEKRPTVIHSKSETAEVRQYANSIYYSTKELVNFVKQRQQSDPDALFVILGDHLPNLGLGNQGYVESGLLESKRLEFDRKMHQTYLSSLLLIIDGKNGPVPLPPLSMYEVPAIVLELLGGSQHHLRLARRNDSMHVRPLDIGGALLVDDDGDVAYCKPGNNQSQCKQVRNWLENLNVLGNDLARGQQFGRQVPTDVALEANSIAQAGENLEMTSKPVRFDITDDFNVFNRESGELYLPSINTASGRVFSASLTQTSQNPWRFLLRSYQPSDSMTLTPVSMNMTEGWLHLPEVYDDQHNLVSELSHKQMHIISENEQLYVELVELVAGSELAE